MTGACDFAPIVNDILTYSQDYPFNLNTEPLTRQWEKAKKKIIDKYFGGKTYVRSEYPVKITLSEAQQSEKFYEFIKALEENNILTIELRDFLESNKEGFFNNTVIESYPSLNISPGTKLSKSLRRFISDDTSIRWAQDIASRFMQENKIEGYIYLSVDPRDFLTLSENNSNWRSCHTLDGDYRAGNLSYMVDETTIVAYIANDKPEHLKCMPHNIKWFSKKWRTLIHTNITKIDCIYYNKQYPFSSDNLLYIVGSFISRIFGTGEQEMIAVGCKLTNSSNNWLYGISGSSKNYICINSNKIFPAEDMINDKDYLGFCDLIHSPTYEPIISIRCNKKIKEKQLKIKIGKKVLCACCGKEFIDREDSFLCSKCIAENDADEDFFFRCDDCGRRIYPEDEYFPIDENYYCCKQCYNLRQLEDMTIEEKEK